MPALAKVAVSCLRARARALIVHNEQEGRAGGLVGLIALIALIDAPIWPFLGLSILPNL